MVGLGRRLRVAPEDGPRARLGVGALEVGAHSQPFPKPCRLATDGVFSSCVLHALIGGYQNFNE